MVVDGRWFRLQAEILKNVAERPRSPKSLPDGSSDTQSTDSWGRMHGSNSDHPLSHVHITIGNSIQDKFHLEDMVSPVPSTTGGPVQPLDSIPENMRSADTMDEGSATGAPDSDTLEMLLPGPYSIEAAAEAVGSRRGGPRRPPRPPPPRRDAGAASDGMFHVSMDRSDIDSLPVLDSSTGGGLLPAAMRSANGRHVYGAMTSATNGAVKTDETGKPWLRQQTQPSSGSEDGAFDPALCELAKSMPLTEPHPNGAGALPPPQNPLGTQRTSDASAIETSGPMSGSGAHGGASLGNTADFSPTLPPLTSPFTFDFLLRQRSARGPVAGYATPSAFEAEPAVAEAAEAAAALAGGDRLGFGAFGADAADFPPLEAGMSASFRTSTRADEAPLSPQLASPFDALPAAQPQVSFDSGGSAEGRQDKTAPFFRPLDGAEQDPAAGVRGAFIPPGEAYTPDVQASTAAPANGHSPAISVRGTNDTVSPTSIGEDAPAHLSVHSNHPSMSMSSTVAPGGADSRSPTKALPLRPDVSGAEPPLTRPQDAVTASQHTVMASGTQPSMPRLSDSSLGASSFDVEPPIALLNTFAVQQYNTPFSRPPSQSERTRRMGSSGSGGRRGGGAARTTSNASRTISNASRLNLVDMFEGAPPAAPPARAPLLESSFDAEPTAASAAPAPPPPSARTPIARAPSSSSLAFGGPAVHVQQLVSGFDAEPATARGAPVDAFAPALPSSFDAEPRSATATAPRLPSFAADAPQLPQLVSLFDLEPAAAGGSGGRPPLMVAHVLPSMFDSEPAGVGGAAGQPPFAPPAAQALASPFTPPSRSTSRSSLDRLRSSSRHPSFDHSAGLSRVVSSTRSRRGGQTSASTRPHTPTTPSPLHAEQQRAQRQPSGPVPIAPALPTSFQVEPPAASAMAIPPPQSPSAHPRTELPMSFAAEHRISSHALRLDSTGLGGTSSYTPSPVANRAVSRVSVFDFDPPSSAGSMASGTPPPPRERTPPPRSPSAQPPRSSVNELMAGPPAQRNVSAILQSVRDSLASVSGASSRSPHAEVFSRNQSPEQTVSQYPGFTGIDTPSPGVSGDGNVAQLAADQGPAANYARAVAARHSEAVHRGSPFHSGHALSAEEMWASQSVSGRPLSLPSSASGLLTTHPQHPPTSIGAEPVRCPAPSASGLHPRIAIHSRSMCGRLLPCGSLLSCSSTVPVMLPHHVSASCLSPLASSSAVCCVVRFADDSSVPCHSQNRLADG